MKEVPQPTDQNDRLQALLSQWQELERQGRKVTATELCADCPELATELEKAASAVARAFPRLPPLPSRRGDALSLPDAVAGARYRVEEKLDEGSMGAVYRAHDRALGRTVALKFLKPQSLTPTLLARFEAEARAVARLAHPHIIQVFDVGQMPAPEGAPLCPFLALEFVPGGSLARLAGEKLPVVEAARLVALLARAVQHAHERGIVHRDLKPANVLLAPATGVAALDTPLGCPKVTDFGLARELSVHWRQTQTGMVMGTPAYMAPEQANGLPDVGPPADVWALGVILYQLLAGQLPFDAEFPTDLLYRICHEAPVALHVLRPGIANALERTCLDCLKKDPQRRPSAQALAERLEVICQGGGDTEPAMAAPSLALRPAAREGGGPAMPAGPRPPDRRPTRRTLLLAGLGALAVGAAGVLLWPYRPRSSPAGKPLHIQSLEVRHFAVDGQDVEPRGLLGEQSFMTRFGDQFQLSVVLSEPAYFYVIGFAANGEEQLRWPADPDDHAQAERAPPRLAQLRLPQGDVRLTLDDSPKGGLEVCAVAASLRPLPPYAEWRRQRSLTWKALPAGKVVWRADPKGTYAGLAGERPDRASVKEGVGVPPLASLCRALLGGGVEAVEAIAFPVRAKEGE
jgi:hypothetical protein